MPWNEVETGAFEAHAKMYGTGGYLEQAKAALSAGTIAAFLKDLLDKLGPIIGPIIVNYLLGLLHLPGIPSGLPSNVPATTTTITV